MVSNTFKLNNPPIVEAVLDIDCDMTPALDITTLEAPFRDAFRAHYPKFRTQIIQEHQIEASVDGAPKMTTRRGFQAFQLLQEDEKQLVQIRAHGFSFNRLAPYTSLDDYLPEMERSWRLFMELAKPVQIRLVRLRYINRIFLPMNERKLVVLNDYFKFGPRLPDEDKLTFVGFLNQHLAVETATGNQVNITLAAQPQEHDRLPVILDIEAVRTQSIEPNDWASLHSIIQSLRNLKNLVFENSLTPQCLNLFQ